MVYILGYPEISSYSSQTDSEAILRYHSMLGDICMARVLLRMPDVLLKQIDTVRAEVAQGAGWPIDRTAFLLRLISEGLERFGRRRVPRVPAPAGDGGTDGGDLG